MFPSSYVRKIMAGLKEEMRERGSIEVLTKEIEKLIERTKEERALLAKSEKLEKLVAELQKTIANERIANEEEKKRVLNELAEEQVLYGEEKISPGLKGYATLTG